MRKAVFLDRDGVINRERGQHTWRIEDFEVLPDVPVALRALQEAGHALIVITNQSGIGSGLPVNPGKAHHVHNQFQQATDHNTREVQLKAIFEFFEFGELEPLPPIPFNQMA